MLLPQFLNHVSLEPVIFLYYCALPLTALASQNLLLQKVCLGGTVAPPVGVRECHDELKAQKEVIFIQTWKELVLLVGPVVFVMFAGPWSDSHGRRRKPLIYLPLLGQMLSDLLSILNVYFWSWSPSVAALSASILPAATGWRHCFTIGVITLVCDNTAESSRMVKVGIVYAMFFFSTPCGTFMFGLIFNKIGFYGVFFLCIAINMTATLYLFILIPENQVKKDEVKLKAWEKLFDSQQMVQCFKTVFKPRDGYQRAVVILSIAVAPLTLAPFLGEYAVLYFFLRYKFHWDAVSYGYYSAYKLLVIFFGTCVTLGVFSHMLRLPDAIIGAISMVTLIITAVANAFASSPWELFLYPLIDFMHGAGMAVVYSIISKNVDSSEIGQVNSVIGIADALYSLVNMPLYNQFYNHTFVQMPGAFFLLSTVYGAISFVLFYLIYVLQKKTKQISA